MDLHELRDIAIEAAIQAGRITLEYFQTSSLIVETKENQSPVTMADRRSEERIREIIRTHYPGHGVHGEEEGASVGSEPVTWIVDPLDGTKSFIHGVPLYGVLIGVQVEGEVAVGVVNMPALGELYWAVRGEGAYWNGRRCQVSSVSTLADATVLTTDTRGLRRDRERMAGYHRVSQRAGLVRGWGDCYGHMLVASGRAEVMLDPSVSIWDIAAVSVIVEEAGGIFTDWRGRRTIGDDSGVSTNAHLAAPVREVLLTADDPA